jgi:hypothetical protein
MRGASEKIKNQPQHLFRPPSVNFSQYCRNLSHETVPLRRLKKPFPYLVTLIIKEICYEPNSLWNLPLSKVYWLDFIQLHYSFEASISHRLASASPTCNCFQRVGGVHSLRRVLYTSCHDRLTTWNWLYSSNFVSPFCFLIFASSFQPLSLLFRIESLYSPSRAQSTGLTWGTTELVQHFCLYGEFTSAQVRCST